MSTYQIRVLQPNGDSLADELAGMLRAAIADNGRITVRTFPSGKHRGHELVYLDLIPAAPPPPPTAPRQRIARRRIGGAS